MWPGTSYAIISMKITIIFDLVFGIFFNLKFDRQTKMIVVGLEKRPILCLQIIIDGAEFYIESDGIAKWNKLILKKSIMKFL